MSDKDLNPEDNLKPESHQKISNPTPITGGESRESADDAAKRSGERLRHRDRAVTADDFVEMALEEFPTIGRVVIACGVVGSLILTGWMLSDIKGPQGRVGPDPVLAIETNTPTAVPVSPTAVPEVAPTTGPATATSRPTAVPSSTPRPIEINFNADSYSIVQGECTTLRWDVFAADTVRVLGAEVEHTEAEQVCPMVSTTYTLFAENEIESAENSFLIEVVVPTATPEFGCTGYDQNDQLICKESCGPNDPGDPCEID